ncbi:MAG TPA: acyl-CoA thioesterase [Candidatus Baltobacteraceae bacterium]|nr:acyl-CoA thioesterase [Candidatus Baltobacteraceae bacterium]
MLSLYEAGGEAGWLRSFRFALELRPRFCETDALGHVSNTVYTSYWEAARLRYFEALGEAADSPRRVLAFSHMAVEIATRMLRPCFYDEELLLHARVVAMGRSSLTFEHALSAVEDGEIRAIGRIAVVASDGERAIPWTAGQRAKIEAFEGRSFPLPAAAEQ